MKKLVITSLCVVLVLGLAGCGVVGVTVPTPDSGSVPAVSALSAPTPAPTPSPTPAPATAAKFASGKNSSFVAFYRGTVTAVGCKRLRDGSITTVTLKRYDGTDYGAPMLTFDFTADTLADFAPEVGQYLEVCYNRPTKDAEVVNTAISATKYPSAEAVNYNGVVKAIIPSPGKPGEGKLVMVNFGMDLNAVYPTELPPPGEPFAGNPEIHFTYNSETTFNLSFDELKVGDELNIFWDGKTTDSLPQQAVALEIRLYVMSPSNPETLFLNKSGPEVLPSDYPRVTFELTNSSRHNIALGKNYRLEFKRDGIWQPITYNGKDSFGRLDAVAYHLPIKPGEVRTVGAYIGAVREYDPKTEEKRLPLGDYRITLRINDSVDLSTEFIVRAAEDIAEDTSKFEIKTSVLFCTGDEELINYTIINKTDEEAGYGYGEGLEYLKDGIWKPYPTVKTITNTEMGVALFAHSTNKEQLDLTYYKRPLPEGSYRISKFLDVSHYAYFSVGSPE